MDEQQRARRFRISKIKLLIAAVILNILIVATFLTSSPNISPASGWIVAMNKGLYRVGIKSSYNLKEIHRNSGKLSPEECIACHGTMKTSKLPLHRMHLTTSLAKFSCPDCHDRIDMDKVSNERAVHLVNVGFCKNCHSQFSGLNEKSAMKPVDFQADCTLCHTGKHAFRHAKPYLSHIIPPRECKGCHGQRVLPWRPEHTKEDWVQVHGKIALEGGSQKCMSCHEYGLAFCKDCHSKKPPSHKPKDLWLGKHQVRAKQDTRTCLACHQAEFCKKCHMGHTPDWQLNHYKYVLKEGTQMCQNCHSAIFCESCHTSFRQAQLSQKGGGIL